MKKKLKVSFADMWGFGTRRFNNESSYFYKSLSLRFDIEIVSNYSDIHIFSCFGSETVKIKSNLFIFFCGESPQNANTSVAKIIQSEAENRVASIGCTKISEFHYWLPLWALYIDWFGDGIRRSTTDDPAYLINPKLLVSRKIVSNKKRRFCNFIYTNPDSSRLYLLEKLRSYKHVDCLGKLLNNSGFQLRGTEFDKLAEQSLYKFSVSFENSFAYDYNTEKLIHAYSMGSIPIYFGNINTEEINTDALIYWNGNDSIDSILKEVIEIDNSNSKFLAKAKQPLFINNKYPARVSPVSFVSWIETII